MSEDLRLDYILNHSRDLIALVDREYRYRYVNEAYCTYVGRKQEELIGSTVAEILGENHFAIRLKNTFDRCLEGTETEYVEEMTIGPTRADLHVSYYPYKSGDTISHALVVAHDVTRITELEKRLSRFEFLDPLTGLFNRRSLAVILDKEIYKAGRTRHPIQHAVLFVSLGNFAEIHQIVGPAAADLLLENTGMRIRDAIRESDYVFRYEGNDLTVLLTNIVRAEDAALVAKKLHEEIVIPYSRPGIEIRVHPVIGISVYPQDGDSAEDLISHANSALVEAKRLDRPFGMYSQVTHELAMDRIFLRSDLQRAFENSQFVLNYQPFVDIHGIPYGAEALVRWNHPTRGLLMPAAFISLAEETRLISSIDRWALFEVCRQLALWDDIPDAFISINISARDLLDEYLVEVVQLALQNAGSLEPGRLKLELTERISMDDPEFSISTMRALMDMGVDVWIDDFGTGQSSLSYLKQLPANVLKIDKVFIDQIADNEEDREYLISISRAIQSRGKRIVIEGVSNADQFKQLQSITCEYLQGFYFSRPIGAEDLHDLIASKARLPLLGADQNEVGA